MKQKLLFSSILLFFIVTFQFAIAQSIQSDYLVRSTTGVSGSSVTSSQNDKTFIVQQSVGQSSAIGTFNTTKYSIRQGFIQPDVLSKIINNNISLDLEASFYPNPFVESVTLAFVEKIEGKVEVAVFDMLGRLVFLNSYIAEQNLKVQFHNLSVSDYILKVTANNKQFVKNIIKK
ncbi:T9SS type A sorting domain-containing protein [Lutibacter sp.]|uniref:T9SS type A sorting domain-containing protein n=1 Tax=Lutibacter sp. TaxID=1925666 RepID=UPI0025C449A8|nr:T9SS type A sorting domain-containing protein [Lutibacter sp.]MCF6167417.1 T9SS type A sorting domain-containing protein [Lutibacter sp.]